MTEDQRGIPRRFFDHLKSQGYLGCIGNIVAAIILAAATLGAVYLASPNQLDFLCHHSTFKGKHWPVLAGGLWNPREDFVRYIRDAEVTGDKASIIRAPLLIEKGRFEILISIPHYTSDCRAHIVFGEDLGSGEYLSGGIGGKNAAYSLFVSNKDSENSVHRKGRSPTGPVVGRIGVDIRDGAASLLVDGNTVIDHKERAINGPMEIGLLVQGCEEVLFMCPDRT